MKSPAWVGFVSHSTSILYPLPSIHGRNRHLIRGRQQETCSAYTRVRGDEDGS